MARTRKPRRTPVPLRYALARNERSERMDYERTLRVGFGDSFVRAAKERIILAVEGELDHRSWWVY